MHYSLEPHQESRDVGVAVEPREGTVVALPLSWYEYAERYVTALVRSETLGQLIREAPSRYHHLIEQWVEQILDGAVEIFEHRSPSGDTLEGLSGISAAHARALSRQPLPDLPADVPLDSRLESLRFDQFIEDTYRLGDPPTLIQFEWIPPEILVEYGTVGAGLEGNYATIPVQNHLAVKRELGALGFTVHDATEQLGRIQNAIDSAAHRFHNLGR